MIATFAKIKGEWRFEGFVDTEIEANKMAIDVIEENGEGTFQWFYLAAK